MDTAKIYKQIGAVVRLGVRAYRPYKRQIFLLTALSFCGGILEGIGINAVIPLLTLVLGLSSPATDTISQVIKSFFQFIHVPFIPRFLLGFIVIVFLVKSAVSLYLSYIQIHITAEYDKALRSRLFSKALRASWPFLLKQKLGNVETLIMIDGPMTTSLLWKISAMITLIASVLMYFIVAFSISAVVTLLTFVLGIVTFVLLRPLLGRIHMTARERATSYQDTLHHISEHISGMKNVKALNVEIPAIQRADAYLESIKISGIRIQLLQQVASQLIPPVGIIYIATILSLAFKTPFISFAALPAILYLIYRIFSYVQQMQNNIQSIVEYIPHLERVISYEDSVKGTEEPASGTASFEFNKELSFNSVSFTYETGRKVLDDVSIKVKKGTLVGIVGPSGAGKTTCVDLMLRLLKPTDGTIALDGVLIEDISLTQWRKKIAYVSQDFFLLHGTIRDNIRFYDETITDEDVWHAAEMAHIDGFIRDSADGLDTQVGDRGIMLSAGQRQRIVIARALARKPQLLILDEATSALDNESEAHIKRVIEELKGRLTIIAIAHRLSTIMDSDELIVLQEGTVVETGSPKELLGNQDSYFYKVYTISQ